ALAAAVVIFFALMVMYRTTEASRHTLVLVVLLLAALLLDSPVPAVGTAAGAAALTHAGYLGLAANGGYDVRVRHEVVAGESAALQAVLAASQAEVPDEDPWEHTVAYSFGDGAHVGMLYAVPDGMGLQFDEAAYLEDEEHAIQSRYMMTSSGSAVEQRLLEEGWTLLYQGQYCTVYERG